MDGDLQKHKYSRVALFYPVPPGQDVDTDLDERFCEVQENTGIENLRLTIVDNNERLLFNYLLK